MRVGYHLDHFICVTDKKHYGIEKFHDFQTKLFK